MPEGRRRRLELTEALEAVGGLGPFQFLLFALLFVIGSFHGARMTSGYYFLYDQEHRCAPLTAPNATIYQPYAIWMNTSHNNASDDSCHIYNATDDNYIESNGDISSFIPCPHGWVYDTSVMEWTVTAEYNLVCDRKMFRSHANTALMLGCMVGGIVFGRISDRFGRQFSFHCAVVVFVSFGVGMAWASNFYIFVVMYAITGMASVGLFQAALVTALEFVLPKDRKIPGLLINTFFPIGECILTGVAFGFRNWRWIAVTISAPAVLLFSYYWVVPESIRWLMLHKKYQQIEKILKRVAKINGRAVPQDDDDDCDDFAELLQSYDAENREIQEIQCRDSFFHMFRYCNLTQRVFCSCFNWLAVNLAYFGLVYNSTELGQGIFMNFFLGCIVEAPSHIVSVLLVDRIGRKYIHCFYFLLITVASAISIIVSLQVEGATWVLLLMTMVGKFAAAGATGTSFLWMTELFPTSLRSTGVGIGLASARVGAIISAYLIQKSQELNSSLGVAVPYIVFCAVGAVTLVLCVFLPETSGKDLPDTVEEAHHFGRNPEREHLKTEVQRRDYGAHDNQPLIQA